MSALRPARVIARGRAGQPGKGSPHHLTSRLRAASAFSRAASLIQVTLQGRQGALAADLSHLPQVEASLIGSGGS